MKWPVTEKFYLLILFCIVEWLSSILSNTCSCVCRALDLKKSFLPTYSIDWKHLNSNSTCNWLYKLWGWFVFPSILEALCKDVQLGPNVSLSEIADLTPGYVGSDLKTLISITNACALHRIICECKRNNKNLKAVHEGWWFVTVVFIKLCKQIEFFFLSVIPE